jgi:hypothetical protein
MTEPSRRTSVRGREQLEPRRGAADQTLQELGIETMQVLERVEHRKTRVGAQEHRGISIRQMQVHQ